ncbi:agmatinase [Roseovarius faecimaris]|uniref:Agmatinase n=1 Tax=Roseovarius faecimaris TaxID=2494550 RepID=A0A6I6IYC3_9RHOB|nr:agmatinase [Roseovarius faecimaris]
MVFGAPHGTPYPGIVNENYAQAPNTLRRALEQEAGWPDHWDFDLGGPLVHGTGFKVADAGDLQTASQDGPGNRALIREATAEIVARGAIPVMIGGDDSVPIPFIEALAPHGPLTIVQVDAHIDWRQERRGEPMGFSSTMRRASEMAHVEKIVHVGIRGLGSARRGEVELAREWGAEIVTARQLHAEGVAAVMRHVEKGSNTLITMDCDALDAGIMPAVMAPTPGGLSYYQALDLIEAVATQTSLVGFDMIEFVPERDVDGAASVTAARILAHVLGRCARAAA